MMNNIQSQLPPVCDAACQRQKRINGLKTSLDSKSLTKDTDPAGYQQARIAYFTEVEGQDWLEKEKERISKDEIEPVIASYRAQFNSLKDESKNQGIFVNLMNSVKSYQAGNEEQVHYLDKKFKADSDHASVLNRLNELQSSEVSTTQSDGPSIIHIILAILGIVIVYKIYTSFFSSTPTVGGKRVLNKLIR